MKRQYRQGDVFVIESAIPSTAEKQPQTARIILEQGTATGHSHGINRTEQADLFVDGIHKYLDVRGEAPVTHEEHSTINLPEGTYEVRRQITWSALEEMGRVVAD